MDGKPVKWTRMGISSNSSLDIVTFDTKLGISFEIFVKIDSLLLKLRTKIRMWLGLKHPNIFHGRNELRLLFRMQKLLALDSSIS